MRNAIAQIKVEQALIRGACFLGHTFEIVDDIIPYSDRYLTFQLGRYGFFRDLIFDKSYSLWIV
jgi:hypothetical protein